MYNYWSSGLMSLKMFEYEFWYSYKQNGHPQKISLKLVQNKNTKY